MDMGSGVNWPAPARVRETEAALGQGEQEQSSELSEGTGGPGIGSWRKGEGGKESLTSEFLD